MFRAMLVAHREYGSAVNSVASAYDLRFPLQRYQPVERGSRRQRSKTPQRPAKVWCPVRPPDPPGAVFSSSVPLRVRVLQQGRPSVQSTANHCGYRPGASRRPGPPGSQPHQRMLGADHLPEGSLGLLRVRRSPASDHRASLSSIRSRRLWLEFGDRSPPPALAMPGMAAKTKNGNEESPHVMHPPLDLLRIEMKATPAWFNQKVGGHPDD